ncbi:MAG: hypothetical protein ABI425_05600 [Patescibacteria group bacterium]
MNDDVTPITVDPQTVSDVQASSSVDEVVAQAAAVQDLFKNDDTPQSDQPLANGPDDLTQPVPATPAQRSPLDILEEILSKEEKKNETPAVEQGPSLEELEQVKQQEAEKQSMIEDARKKMMTETESDEQKKRDMIRQQQIDANKIVSPFEIRQLEHKKINK